MFLKTGCVAEADLDTCKTKSAEKLSDVCLHVFKHVCMFTTFLQLCTTLFTQCLQPFVQFVLQLVYTIFVHVFACCFNYFLQRVYKIVKNIEEGLAHIVAVHLKTI